MDLEARITGCLLGGAAGDAIGLPHEGLARARLRRLADRPLTHALWRGRGMISDDTEHACMTAQALLAAPDDPGRFARALAWRLRLWLLCLPAAIGWGTLRALVRLWLGWPPARSGVDSAGNGPAMRAPILGACLADPAALQAYVAASTRITHRDPRALAGALAVARATAHVVHRGDEPAAALAAARAACDDPELAAALDLAREHDARGASPEAFACALGQVDGVSGYIHHTVPVALYCWLRAPRDVRAAVESAVRLGGDTDTVAAIVGGLAGATAGASAVPADWLAGLREAPRDVAWLRRLGARLARADRPGPLPLAWPLLPLRSLVFTLVVLAHGFARLLRLR
jgi:ADP-ribosylglycohydrolase